MFWGLIMEPQRRYTQQVKKSFHITMAALDISTSSEEPAQVMCGFEGRNYLLCTLKKPDLLQCPLDLTFNTGSEVSFAANGKCHVHLTGYLAEEDLLDAEEPEGEEEEEEQEEDQELNDIVEQKSNKRTKKVLENGPPAKKIKNAKVTSSQNKSQNLDSDESDSEPDIKTLLEKSLEDSDDDSDAIIDEEGEEEESEDDEEELENEDDDSSLSEGDSDEEEEKVTPLKMNGVPKKQEPESRKQKKDKKEKHLEHDKKSSKSELKKEVKTPNKENQASRKKVIQGGVIVEDIREGQGLPVKNGKIVTVYYEGRLKQNNKVFDSTTKGTGFSFRLGAGDVIKGWDVGVLGMKPGGKRRITCPPPMGYGQKGSPPAIPPNSTLVFEVELRKCN